MKNKKVLKALQTNTIICPQCGGENKLKADERFIECEYCSSAIYVDKSRVVNHYVVNSNFNQEQAIGNVRRWMAGNFHVKDLDKNANIQRTDFYYFPLWYFKLKEGSNDKIMLQPAHSTPISEIKSINIPAGNLKPFQVKDFDMNQFVQPDVFFESAKNWLEQSGANVETIAESNLVHIPFYHVHYYYKNEHYSCLVEASSGKVYANIWPAKSEAPFRILFGASIAVFLLASILSYIIAFVVGSGSSLTIIAEMIKIPVYLFASIPLIGAAYFIAKKV